VSEVLFGQFAFDIETGVLRRGDRIVRLQPQPARVLAVLLDANGDVVSRETLQQRVWTDGTFVDFERGLNFCIAQIRSVLGDSAESPRYVETLPRRGYRFIAPVRRSADPVAAGSHASVGPAETASARRFGLVPAAAFAMCVLATALLVAVAWSGADRRDVERIAVIPFDNETGMDEFDIIARGVADATVARLATPERLGRVSVIGNAGELFQPRAFRDLKGIGERLGADYILLAQMKRDAAGVRLIAHLIRVTDEVHVWANTFDRPSFTLAVQAEIAESLAAAVVKTLSPSSSAP
jgi:DNA-binding winged helix-turn-helix (wHTH) protein/TolB-like protein